MKTYRIYRQPNILPLFPLCALLLSLLSWVPAQEEEKAEKAEKKSAAGKGEKALEAKTKIELPADGTTPNYWLLNFHAGHLRMITPRTGLGAGRVYWYLVYTLENPGKEDREVFINIMASSDRAKTYGDLYLPVVEKAIEKQEGKVLWGKTDEFEILEKRNPQDPRYSYLTLKAGEKRESVAVFNRLDPNANDITISVAGLSNEIKSVTKADGSKVLEERIRELKYKRPGDEFAITRDSFQLVGESWVRRQVDLTAPAAEPK